MGCFGAVTQLRGLIWPLYCSPRVSHGKQTPAHRTRSSLCTAPLGCRKRRVHTRGSQVTCQSHDSHPEPAGSDLTLTTSAQLLDATGLFDLQHSTLPKPFLPSLGVTLHSHLFFFSGIGSHCVAQADLELMTLLHLAPACWGDRLDPLSFLKSLMKPSVPASASASIQRTLPPQQNGSLAWAPAISHTHNGGCCGDSAC